uniref:CMP-N-acetylneuraminate-beta-galactosamide-alpha-2,3-sialyltransferase 1 n=1 Tax=Neogobius melanostomus TaxID=47308 RepID=A0A8C6TAD2_9GOBI
VSESAKVCLVFLGVFLSDVMNSSSKHTVKRTVFLLLLCFSGICTIWKVSEMPTSFELYLKNTECGCETCLMQNNSWFMQRFQKNITPLLTSNYNLSQEAFNWWKVRAPLRLPFVLNKIFEVFPAYPPVPEPGLDGCRTCAVVGNSINLNKSHYGKLIDYHTFVFRINAGKTKGFEEDVGNRTTHRVMYPESATNLDNSTHLVLIPFKIRDLQWLVDAFTTGSNVMVVNPAFMRYVHQSWLEKKGQYPSTGFMVVILALHLCDEVSVFGFGADSDGNWSHYWEVLRNKKLKTGPHPGSVEYKMILELARQGRVAFYRGW